MSEYRVVAGVPDVETYRALRVAAGLSGKSVEAAEAGLPQTWYGVLVRRGEQVVGMGRVVGDGCHLQVVDVCLRPEHQGRGLGKQVMAAIVAELERRAPSTAYVSLIADGDAKHLYAQYGFSETAPASVAMARRF